MMTVFDGDYEMFHRVRLEVRKEIEKHKDERDPMTINELLY